MTIRTNANSQFKISRWHIFLLLFVVILRLVYLRNQSIELSNFFCAINQYIKSGVFTSVPANDHYASREY